MNRIRTILIDDSALMRKMLSRIISSDAEIELVGVADNGQNGFKMTMDLKPDVVITDMMMPDFDGMYVVNSVMDKIPTPIILLSSLDKGDSRIFDALGHGAFEFIDKASSIENKDIRSRLIDVIKEASRTDISLLKLKQLSKKNIASHSFTEKPNYEIIVIGASTGGPGAVEYIINNLPKNLKIPVVVAQHMPHRFLETFTERLNDLSHLPVKLPRRGEYLKGGIIYIAPGEANMRIEKNILTGLPMVNFTDRKYEEFNYPSVDCLFESVADTYEGKSIAVILTGMGKDGVKGLQKINAKSGFTIAQDEESSVVYGMPKAANEAGVIRQVLGLKQIPGYVISCL
jgi:two-component system chemotaxis response regulator CheB